MFLPSAITAGLTVDRRMFLRAKKGMKIRSERLIKTPKLYWNDPALVLHLVTLAAKVRATVVKGSA